MGYHDLEAGARPAGHAERKAIGVAGPHPWVDRAAEFVDDLGFDPVHAGGLPAGVAFQPGTEGFGANGSSESLTRLLGSFPSSERGVEVAAARSTLPSPWTHDAWRRQDATTSQHRAPSEHETRPDRWHK